MFPVIELFRFAAITLLFLCAIMLGRNIPGDFRKRKRIGFMELIMFIGLITVGVAQALIWFRE